MEVGAKKNWALLAILALIIVMLLAVWSVKPTAGDYIEVEAQQGVWDLHEVDLSKHVVCLVGEVEYVAEELLTPEEFAVSSKIEYGHPQHSYQYCTSRITVNLPKGSYLIAGSSVDFASKLFANDELLLSVGQVGESRETVRPDTGFFVLPVQAGEDDTLTIVQQASNFVHRESGGHGRIYLGAPEVMDTYIAQRLWPETIVMGCYFVLFVLHLVLFVLQRSYKQNLLFSLFCLTWFFRTGVTANSLLTMVVPWLSWTAAFRIEYLALPLTCVLLVWLLHLMFPGTLQRWFLFVVSALCGVVALLYLFIDTVWMSYTVVPFEIVMGVVALFILIRFSLKLRRITIEQLVILLGFAFFLFAFIWDALFYNGILLIQGMHFALSEMAMTVFILFGMVAMTYGTLRQVATARENERIALLEAEALRNEALLKEALHKAIPEGHLVERGALTLNTLAAQAYVSGEDMLLAPKEFALLHLLLKHEGSALDKEQLYKEVWKQPLADDTQAMRSALSRLRKKLEGSGFTIRHTRGNGYALVQDDTLE